MSSDYRMNLVWSSHGEQLRADLERNLAGLTMFDRGIKTNTRSLGMWGQQMKAVGTTIRYALAGAVTYGVVTAVGSLGQFEDKLGEIDALAAKLTRDGRLQGLGDNLQGVGDRALELSNTLGVAVGDIETFMSRFYSSFEAPAGMRGIQQMRGFVNEVGKLSLVLGSEAGDPTQLASGIAGFIQGMGPAASRNPGRSAGRVSDIIAAVIKRSPVLTGVDITRDIGRLGAAQTAMAMTPEQIFAIYGAASLRGGSGAVIGRGVAQLLTSSLLKPGPKQLQAFAQAGLPIDPNALRSMGGWNVINQLLQRVTTGPVSFKNAAALRADSGMSDEEAIAASGASGINVTLASKLFGRVESLRVFLNLLSVGGPQALQHFIDQIHVAEKDHLAGQMADLRNDQRTLVRAANANKNLNMQIVRGFDPVLHAISRGVIGVSDSALRHPDAATATITGLAGAQIASRVFLGFGLAGGLGRLMRRIPGLSSIPGLGRLAARGTGLAAASVVGSGLGAFTSTGSGKRGDPVWVVIDPLSWFMPGAPGGQGYGPQGQISPTRIPNKDMRESSRLSTFLKGAGGTAALSSSAAAAVGLVLASAGDTGGGPQGMASVLARINKSRFPHAYNLIRNMQTQDPAYLDPASRVIQDRLMAGTLSARRAEAMLTKMQMEGSAEVILQLVPDQALKGIVKAVGDTAVAVKLWPKSSGGGRPQHRGKNKSVRGQGTR